MPIILLLLMLAPCLATAQDVPKGSSYDPRVQKVYYNALDVTRINARLGFVTVIIFDEDEVVEKAVSGFEAGWKVTQHQNKLFVSPVPVEQEEAISVEDRVGEDGSEGITEVEQSAVVHKFEPSAKDWRTNLFVSTNKRNYSMDLNLVEAARSNYAHIVEYSYPEKDIEKEDKEQIKTILAKNNIPRNWNYFVKVGKESNDIVPDFAYDDGALTYLGFGEGKTLPSVFLLSSGKEQIINYSVEQKGNYKVMVIHKLNKAFVLRYGSMSIGILNKSFGEYSKPYNSTISQVVTREEINNGKTSE